MLNNKEVVVEVVLAVEFEGGGLELSAQLQALPDPCLVAKISPSIEPCVPPIVRKAPVMMMNTLQATFPFHLRPGLLNFQLSCSHIHP